jgi:protein-tyrosine phosphatase
MSDTFDISQLPVGQGQLALCRMPGAVTPLAADVRALADLGATCVLTLTPQAELQKAGSADLAAVLAAQGMDWLHLPIDDFGTPSPAQQADWDALSRMVQARIDKGETIAIHCRAGLGRTGMIALRLMAQHGELPETALARLRASRPGSVERPAQFEWAAQGYEPRAGMLDAKS